MTKPKLRRPMYDVIRDRCALAVTYAEDGAYHSAYRILNQIALETKQHAERVMPSPHTDLTQ